VIGDHTHLAKVCFCASRDRAAQRLADQTRALCDDVRHIIISADIPKRA
jgi:hypothetical protein